MNWLKVLLLRFLPRPILLPLKKLHHARALRTVRLDEEMDLKVVQCLVKLGDTAMDVGANVGLYTRMLSEWVGPTGRVVSLEPVPDTFAVLRHVIRKLRLANVVALDRAASDQGGQVAMAIPLGQHGVDNPYQARVTGSHAPVAGEIALQAVRLDSVADSLHLDVDFVKVDVEGHELSCIRGALATIERCRPSLLIEVSGDPDQPSSSAAELCSELRLRGYAIYWFDGLRLHERRPGDSSTNYFFLQPRALEKLRNSGLT